MVTAWHWRGDNSLTNLQLNQSWLKWLTIWNQLSKNESKGNPGLVLLYNFVHFKITCVSRKEFGPIFYFLFIFLFEPRFIFFIYILVGSQRILSWRSILVISILTPSESCGIIMGFFITCVFCLLVVPPVSVPVTTRANLVSCHVLPSYLLELQLTLTHWPWSNLDTVLKMQFSIIVLLISIFTSWDLMIMPSAPHPDECLGTFFLMINQHCLRNFR